jgi:glycosyltransferase involved in cell wall biosynthesis
MKSPTLSELPAPPSEKSGWPWTAGPDIRQHDVDGMPKLSVVTPSFNQAGFIEETIRSVLLQDYPNIEYIVIDGGSTDGSVDIIKKYEKWLDYWVSEPDNGQSHAINKGWNQSSGEILAWLNSDDVYQPGAFSQAAAYLNKHQTVGMVYGDCDMIDQTGTTTGRCPSMAFSLKALVCNQWFISQPATLFRKTAVEKAGKVNESLHLVMDWEYFLRIAFNDIVTYLPVDIAKFRVWEDAKTSSQSIRSAKEKLLVLERIFSSNDKKNEISEYKKDAFSYVHRWTGDAYGRHQRRWRALQHYIQSIYYRPELIRDSAMRQKLITLLYQGLKTTARSMLHR